LNVSRQKLAAVTTHFFQALVPRFSDNCTMEQSVMELTIFVSYNHTPANFFTIRIHITWQNFN